METLKTSHYCVAEARLAKNGNKNDKPVRFNGTAFYPGAILLVGEIVK